MNFLVSSVAYGAVMFVKSLCKWLLFQTVCIWCSANYSVTPVGYRWVTGANVSAGTLCAVSVFGL